MLRSKNPYLDFARAIALFRRPPHYEPGVHPTAVIHPSAKLGPRAHLGPYVAVSYTHLDVYKRQVPGL